MSVSNEARLKMDAESWLLFSSTLDRFCIFIIKNKHDLAFPRAICYLNSCLSNGGGGLFFYKKDTLSCR
jgi:hypothetical protein